jgi:regulator of protease activity HflC (stomatin/prohibitin superfamily)
LEDLATREVVRYLASADMNDVMSRGRLEASDVLRSQIQTAANDHQLGAKIVFIGLQDIHPPVKVAPDYEKVVGAVHTREAKILGARADGIRTNALAEAQATNVLNQANAYGTERKITAAAKAALFTNQIPAYKAAPEVYAQRSYLQTFAQATAGADKYVMLVTNADEILQLDLTKQIRADLLGSLTPNPAKTNK